jgi:hypothetical protein
MVRKSLAWYLIIAMFVIGVAPRLEAAFSPSEAIGFAGSLRSADTEKIRTAIENKLVSQRLQDLGYTTEEIVTKLSELTDEQLHSFAQRLDTLKVGQDAAGVIIFLLVVAVVVLVVLMATGRRVVVTK